jgi:hypothetical protein
MVNWIEYGRKQMQPNLRYLHGETEENYEKRQSGQQTFGLIAEPGTSSV